MPKPITCTSKDAKKTCLGASEVGFSHLAPHTSAIRDCYRKIVEDETLWEASEIEPILVSEPVTEERENGDVINYGPRFWLFKNRIYQQNHLCWFSLDEWKLLVREEFDKERQYFEKLQAKFSRTTQEIAGRSKIPSQVRIFVWQRDGGRCVECGSNEKLEYDHIIPVSKGGSNTERNLQLLCEFCNRLKSDSIT